MYAGSQDGVFQGPADNPDVDDDVDQDDDDDGHSDCGVCAGPQDWFFQGRADPPIPTGHQLTGASHRISELSKSQISQCRRQIFRIFIFFILSGWQQHFLNLDTDK